MNPKNSKCACVTDWGFTPPMGPQVTRGTYVECKEQIFIAKYPSVTFIWTWETTAKPMRRHVLE